jgi:hypothetical protein
MAMPDQVDRVRIHDGPLCAIKGGRRLRRTIVPNIDGRVKGVFGLLILHPKGRHFGPRKILAGAHHGKARAVDRLVLVQFCLLHEEGMVAAAAGERQLSRTLRIGPLVPTRSGANQENRHGCRRDRANDGYGKHRGQ